MLHIAIQVNDEQKGNLLVEMLAALNFVTTLEVSEVNGNSAGEDGAAAIFYDDPRQSLMLKEEAAFRAIHHQLVEHYLSQYVAIYQGEVVGHDPDEMQVVTQIQTKYPDQVVLIRKVQEKLPPALVFRSPRLVPAL